VTEEGLDDQNPFSRYLFHELGGFHAMQLHRLQTGGCHGMQNGIRIFIHKNPDPTDRGRQCHGNIPCLISSDGPGACGVKNKTNGIRAQGSTGHGFIDLGQAAYFHLG